MPNMALKAADAINAAREAVGAVTNTSFVYIDKDRAIVTVKSLRDLEQIPGAAEIKRLVFPHEAYAKATKTLQGVEWKYYMTRAEYEALGLAESA